MAYIYALVDPITGEIRYVGKSTDPTKRLSFHLSKRSLKTNSPKNLWIRKLLDKGLRPLLVILQKCDPNKWAEAERGWIVMFRMVGAELTNTSDGGEGVLEKTPETPTVRYKRKLPRPTTKLYPKKRKPTIRRPDKI